MRRERDEPPLWTSWTQEVEESFADAFPGTSFTTGPYDGKGGKVVVEVECKHIVEIGQRGLFSKAYPVKWADFTVVFEGY